MDCKPKTLNAACETIRNYIGRNAETMRLLDRVECARSEYELMRHRVFGFDNLSGAWDDRVRRAKAAMNHSDRCWSDCDIEGVHDALSIARHEWLMAAKCIRDSAKPDDNALKSEPE